MNHEHPVSQEELMAYGDGQIDADRASQIRAHVESCANCAKTVADARELSLEMTSWQVEEPREQMVRSVLGALQDRTHPRNSKAPFRWLTKRSALAYGFSGALIVVVSIVAIVVLHDRSELARYESSSSAGLATAEPQSILAPFLLPPPPGTPPPAGTARQYAGAEPAKQSPSPSDPSSGPMIIRTIHLTLITKSFETSRLQIESIVRDSKGYLDNLAIISEPRSPKGLSAVLRIPDDKLDASLIELRKLGQLNQESQNSADITGQYVDLAARLSNARNTEQRLLALLRDRTGSLKDVVAAEGEIARVRENIERMEAERKSFDNKVRYATVQLELSEEYHAQLQPTLPNTRTRVYNAAIEGIESALATILGIALAALAYGPAILIWLAFLFSTGFLAWRSYCFLRSRRHRLS